MLVYDLCDFNFLFLTMKNIIIAKKIIIKPKRIKGKLIISHSYDKHTNKIVPMNKTNITTAEVITILFRSFFDSAGSSAM